MKRLLFIEKRQQARWVRTWSRFGPDVHVVAITGEARQALEEYGVPHSPVSAYSDIHPLAAADEALSQATFHLLQAIETFIADRYAPARFDGPGPLTGNAYCIGYSITAIVKQGLLVRGAIRSCAPDSVMVFDGAVDPWFAAEGYTRNPWIDLLQHDADRGPWQLEILPRLTSTSEEPLLLERLNSTAVDWWHRARRLLRRIVAGSGPDVALPGNVTGLNLLFISSSSFDWAPVVERLKQAQGVSCYKANEMPLHPGHWSSASLASRLEPLVGGTAYDVGVGPIGSDEAETRLVGSLFDEWLRDLGGSSGLRVLGVDVLPLIAGQLRRMVCWGLGLIRQIDEVTRRMLDRVEPHAVCFFALPLLVHQRVAFQCRQRRIPAVVYQHGFGYTVRVQPQDELCDPVHADFVLTYGDGNRMRPNPAFPVRAKYVSIGSARIERMLRRPRQSLQTGQRLRVLWASEFWNHNTLGTFLTEETHRYDLYRTCLEVLARCQDFEVTYRPYPGMEDAIARWIQRTRVPRVRVDGQRAFDELVQRADVVVVTTSSPTVWAEVLALKAPMVLYCDPEQTLLTDAFSADLDRVCRWCRSGPALLDAIRQLAAGGKTSVEGLNRLDTSAFVRKYILHGGRCADRAIAFLNDVCRHRQPLEEWQRPA